MSKQLWQPPRLRHAEDIEGDRRATWLELFFDLVFVVAIAELSHLLSKRLSLQGFLEFLSLFIPVWWCWIGATFYSTRFDTDDLGHRFLTLMQIAFVMTMAVNIPHAFDTSSIDFALSYTAFRGLLVFQYLNAGHYNPSVRSLTQQIAFGFSLSVALWMTSVLVPLPWRFALWGMGLLIELITPLLVGKKMAQFPPSFTHIPERFGLFVMIVLGESMWAVVGGLSEQKVWSLSGISVGLLGLLIAFSFWWIYFDSVDGSALQSIASGRIQIGMSWLYIHLPLAVGLVMTGVAVEHAIKVSAKSLSVGDRWLLCGGVGLCMLALAGLHWLSCKSRGQRRVLANYRLSSAAFVFALAVAAPWAQKSVGRAWGTVELVSLVAIACVIQVVLGLWVDQQMVPTEVALAEVAPAEVTSSDAASARSDQGG